MSDEIPMTAEARALRDEAAGLHAAAKEARAAAAKDLESAEYVLGQAEHRLRTAQATEAGISAREKRLKDELNEPALLARAAEADAKLAKAQELMKAYDKDKHAAMIALARLEENERAAKAAREAA